MINVNKKQYMDTILKRRNRKGKNYLHCEFFIFFKISILVVRFLLCIFYKDLKNGLSYPTFFFVQRAIYILGFNGASLFF